MDTYGCTGAGGTAELQSWAIARAISRPADVREMPWLTPQVSPAIAYLCWVATSARKPRKGGTEAT